MFEGKSKATIRKIIITEQEGACNHCGITEWRGQPITLELEHRDGNNQNDTRDNLECICPNCHSQTPTWRGRNKTKKVSDADMIAMLRETGSIHVSLLNFGMAAKGGNYQRVKRLVEEHNIAIYNKSGVGSKHAKLTEEDLIAIHNWRLQKKPFSWIAAQFGVHKSTIQHAHAGRSYRK